jgi:hypothetical protein
MERELFALSRTKLDQAVDRFRAHRKSSQQKVPADRSRWSFFSAMLQLMVLGLGIHDARGYESTVCCVL